MTDCFCNGSGEPRWASVPDGLNARRTTYENCPCPVGQAAKIARRIDPIWDLAEIPKRFKDLRLETSPHDLIFLAQPESYFFHGKVGVGKTGLAVSIARNLVEAGVVGQVLFVDVPDLLNQIKATYDSEESERSILQRYKEAEFLILDDLGAEHVKNLDWLQDLAYQIINYRHGEMLPTIFTSNLSLGESGKRIGARNAWRISELCGRDNIMEIEGPNLRDKR
jgi:DNA replication protein DnaC